MVKYVCGQSVEHDGVPLGTDLAYVFASDLHVKIGHSIDVYRRCQEINRLALFDVFDVVGIFIGGSFVETMLLRHFMEYQYGGEYLDREGALAEWIDAGCPDELTRRLTGKTP